MIKILLKALLIILLLIWAVLFLFFRKPSEVLMVKIANAYGDTSLIESALEDYKKLGEQYPTENQGLRALVARTDIEPLPLKWTQTMEEIPLDPWGTPFQYRFPGSQNPLRPEIISAGPDKVFGTDDDLSNQDR